MGRRGETKKRKMGGGQTSSVGSHEKTSVASVQSEGKIADERLSARGRSAINARVRELQLIDLNSDRRRWGTGHGGKKQQQKRSGAKRAEEAEQTQLIRRKWK